MSQYYLHDGKDQIGPFTLEQLKEKGINRDTPVWKEGMSSWTKAGELEELSEVVKSIPPTFTTSPPPFKDNISTNQPAPQRKKNNSTALITLIVAVIAVVVTIYLINKNNDNNSGNRGNGNANNNSENFTAPVRNHKTAEEIQDDLGAEERANPLKYLRIVDFKQPRMNLLDETVLEGSIICTAKIAQFKDVILQADYYTVSNTLLSSEKFSRYEIWSNGSNVKFKFKTNAPKEMKKVELTIVDATPVEH